MILQAVTNKLHWHSVGPCPCNENTVKFHLKNILVTLALSQPLPLQRGIRFTASYTRSKSYTDTQPAPAPATVVHAPAPATPRFISQPPPFQTRLTICEKISYQSRARSPVDPKALELITVGDATCTIA